jgi:hypothetical protein
MEKPDWVSWDDVIACIRSADTVNHKKGIHLHIAEVKPDEMKEDLKNGRCIVALYNNKVVGTTSYKIRNLRKWYAWGKVIYHSYEGIRPEYRGTDVYFHLTELKDKYVRESGIKTYQCHTAEGNKTIIKINKIYGFKLVLFRPNSVGLNYYSVTMVKWEDGCPFPDWYLKFMFNLSKYISKIFFTPDFKFRPSLKRL